MEERRVYIFAAVQIVAASALLWLAFLQPGVWDWQRQVGAGLMLVGLTGIATARFQLGRSFSIRAEARQLITYGVYAKIRNPIYVFGTIALAGMVLVLHRPVLWWALPAIIVVQILRARREAHVLERAFGEAYREYRRKTWF